MKPLSGVSPAHRSSSVDFPVPQGRGLAAGGCSAVLRQPALEHVARHATHPAGLAFGQAVDHESVPAVPPDEAQRVWSVGLITLHA